MCYIIKSRFCLKQDRIDLLIKTLFDDTAREDERHDAAMYIGHFDDDRALKALSKIASNPNEEEIILDACGESIARILVMRNSDKKDVIKALAPLAKETAIAFIRNHRPEWLDEEEN